MKWRVWFSINTSHCIPPNQSVLISVFKLLVTMKAINVCVLALLCVGLTAAASYKEDVIGNCGGSEHHKEVVEVKAALWGKVDRVVKYSLAVSITLENTASKNSCEILNDILFSFIFYYLVSTLHSWHQTCRLQIAPSPFRN